MFEQSLTPAIAAPIATAVCGVIAAYSVKYLWDCHERRQRRRNLACLLAAELGGWRAICEARDYDQVAESFLESLRAGNNVAMPNVVDDRSTAIETGRGTFPVAYNNLSEIGLLGTSIASELALFLNLHQGLISDLVAYSRGEWNSRAVPEKIRSIEQNFALYRRCVSISDGLIPRLKGLADNR